MVFLKNKISVEIILEVDLWVMMGGGGGGERAKK